MRTSSQLSKNLSQLDNKPYGALKQLAGSWQFKNFELAIDKVQSDPYAPASRLRCILPLEHTALFDQDLSTQPLRTAAADFIARKISASFAASSTGFFMAKPGQEILLRSSVLIQQEQIQLRFTFQFPARGRRIKGRQGAFELAEYLPELLADSVLGAGFNEAELVEHQQTYTDFLALQAQLKERKLLAFVCNGAILPRRSGNSDLPLPQAVPFYSPDKLQLSLDLPSGRRVEGMGIPRGINLIVGGGFHGKSTLLRALERGVYSHIPGDGREFVACDPSAIMIRAEDGRMVSKTDISPFIGNLPTNISTQIFSSQNASGSTSQAANLAEALEIGAQTLLLDEDTSATNFMIRDQLMRQLIAEDQEPITPFIDRITGLYRQLGVSTVLVVGGSGAFFAVADTVIAMQAYRAHEVTKRAHQLAGKEQHKANEDFDFSGYHPVRTSSSINTASLLPGADRKPARAQGLEVIQLGRQKLDLRYLSQLVDAGQTQTLALCLEQVALLLKRSDLSLSQAVQQLIAELEECGLDRALAGKSSGKVPASWQLRGDLVLPRAAELHQAISRWRGLL